MPLDPELLAIMACPKCHGELQQRSTPESLVCPTCLLRYAIEDGIPNMLIDEASRLEATDLATNRR